MFMFPKFSPAEKSSHPFVRSPAAVSALAESMLDSILICVVALGGLSLNHVRRGEFSAAKSLALRAVELSPHSQIGQMAAGMSMIFSDARLALEHLKKAAAMPGINKDEAAFFVGLAHKQLGETEQARQIWQTLLDESPEDDRLRNALDSL